MQTFSVPVGVGPNRILTPFPERTTLLSPRIRRGHLTNFSTQRPFLGLTRFGLCQVAVPEPDSAVIMLKDMFGRVEGLLYTIADAAVSSSPDMAMETTTTTTKQNSDWLSGITNAMETVLKILKDGLSAVHVPYSYGFAIILLTGIVKTATFPLTKKQVESTIAMRSLAPQIKAIQERYAGDQERIQLETARLYKLAGINPLAGCLPTLATIPIWIGLYRALSNVADEGLLTEGFFWIPSLAGPTTVAARQTGGGTSWLFHFVDGHPPLGWSDTLAYLVLPVLLVVSQYISVQIMQPQQSNDPNLKSSQAITKFLPLVIGYFALSVPSGLSLYWFTNNILSTAQQIWLQKLGGAQNPVKKLNYDKVKKEQLQVQKSLLGETPTKDVTKEGEKLTPEGLGPGDRFKQIKEQEARRRKQREEEKRKAEEAAAQNIQTGRGKLEKEDNLVESEDRHQSNGAALDNSSSNTRGLSSSETVVANGSSSSIELKQDMKSTINRLKESEIADNSSAENNQQTCGAVEKEVTTHSLVGTQAESASKDLKADSRE